MKSPFHDTDIHPEYCRLMLGWDAFEQKQSGLSVIDMNFSGMTGGLPIASRSEVIARLETMLENPAARRDPLFLSQLRAQHSFAKALDAWTPDMKGKPVPAYRHLIAEAQGLAPVPVPQAEIDTSRNRLCGLLADIGLDLEDSYNGLKTLRNGNDILTQEALRPLYDRLHNRSREQMAAIKGGPSQYAFDLETYNDKDVTFGMYLDHPADRFRLRVNVARLTPFNRHMALTFFSHEVLGHCEQLSAWKENIRAGDMPCSYGIFTLHGPEQFAAEGLADFNTLFWTFDDPATPPAKAYEEMRYFIRLVKTNALLVFDETQDKTAAMKYAMDNNPAIDEEEHTKLMTAPFRTLQAQIYDYSYGPSVRLIRTAMEGPGEDAAKSAFLRSLYTEWNNAGTLLRNARALNLSVPGNFPQAGLSSSPALSP